MNLRIVKPLLVLLIVATPLAAQTSDVISFQRTFLLRNVSGTAFNPGDAPHHPILWTRGAWTTFVEGSVSVAQVSETGPVDPQNGTFSVNWFGAGAQRTLGRRGLVLVRARGSLESATIQDDGYPQLLQVVSPESGGPLVDRMRAHESVSEVAVDLAFRTSQSSFLHLYAAPIGDPALGAVPYAQRASAEEFVEAPFSYDVQEPWHYATSVVTAGFGTPYATLEASVFHHAVTTGRHSSIDTGGDIDSQSARLTLSAHNLSLQLSHGTLTDADLTISSASLAYNAERGAASLIYTKRELRPSQDLSSLSAEGLLRGGRNLIMARVETVDRPFEVVTLVGRKRTTHFTIGYLFDALKADAFRAGVGVNIDYHTATHGLETRYGHKPQSIYLYVRLRTDSAQR
ncbi:MAG TPA: hypothetical protein VGR02_05460 [Thermoanaerobaculia bacterium]|nr:hypothetical protein [Thermoanaerobaculia bacterium]